MPEISASELRKLRSLQDRIASANDSLKQVRARRDEFRAEATHLRRELRATNRETAKLQAQLKALIAENAALAARAEAAEDDLAAVTQRAQQLVAENKKLKADGAAMTKQNAELAKSLKGALADRDRLAKQLAVANAQLGDKVANEITPDQLSNLLGSFVRDVGGQTGLTTIGTNLKLKVGFTGTGGGAFVVPALGTDPDNLPELHELTIDLGPQLAADEPDD